MLNNTFRKIFAAKSFDVATGCILYFGCAVQDTLYRRKSKYLTKLEKYTTSSNLLYQAVQIVASDELVELQKFTSYALFRTRASCVSVLCVLISSLSGLFFACILNVCLLLPTMHW